jgi:three-Cys-motif partner protein
MTVPKETIWELDPHTLAKHEILRLYLQAWFPILNAFHQRVIYVDGFCGPGRYIGGEPGSPIIVLKLAATHIKALTGEIVFWFIDSHKDRIEYLKTELARLTLPSNFKVTASHGEFDEKLRVLLNRIDEKNAQLAPTFIFIDPFGFSGVPYSLVRRALEKPHCEVLITFMVDSINRWIDHPEEKVRAHIPEIFGTEEVFKIDRNARNRIGLLRDLYQKQLEKAAKFVRHFEMRDRNNRIQYLLFFATNHRLGHIKIKEAMWAVDPEGDFRFSDATNPGQDVLFGIDQTELLWPILKKTFAGREVTTDQIRGFVEDKTAFLGTHMKATLKEHERPELSARERVQVRGVKADGKPRRKGTFPDGV